MEVTRVHDISILHFFGEVGFMELDLIEKVLCSLRKSNLNKILIDMTSVDHVHYIVLKKLMAEAMALRHQRGDIKLANLNSDTKKLVNFVGADQVFSDYASISEAILSFLNMHDGRGSVMAN